MAARAHWFEDDEAATPADGTGEATEGGDGASDDDGAPEKTAEGD